MRCSTLVGRVALAAAATWLVACGESSFPVRPSPLVANDVTTVGGGSWSGSILLIDGTLTSFNMTLIARSLGQVAGIRRTAQTAGTTEVTGNFQLGNGVTGTVQGLLQGTLQNGSFDGTLSSSSPACSRSYSGPVTESTVAWIARGTAPAGCPLTFSVQLARPRGPGCQYVVSLSQQTFSGLGGSGAVNINTGPECAWAAESLDPWLRVDDGEPKLGSGRVTFAVLTNAQEGREGRLRVAVANQTFLVTQGPACSFSVSPTAIAADGTGGSGTIAVTAPTGCDWTTQSGAPWITVNPASGVASGTVTYVIQPNVGVARTGSFTAAGQTITVTQQASCGATVTPTSLLVDAAGGAGAVTIDAPGGCTWSAVSQDSWIVLGAQGGTGSGRLTFTVSENRQSQRIGSFVVAGERVTITQLSGCTFQLTDTPDRIDGVTPPGLLSGPMFFPSVTGTLTVRTGTTCTYTLTVVARIENTDWVTFDGTGGSPLQGTGTRDFRYTVSINTATASRSGSLTISGDNEAVAITVSFVQNGRPP